MGRQGRWSAVAGTRKVSLPCWVSGRQLGASVAAAHTRQQQQVQRQPPDAPNHKNEGGDAATALAQAQPPWIDSCQVNTRMAAPLRTRMVAFTVPQFQGCGAARGMPPAPPQRAAPSLSPPPANHTEQAERNATPPHRCAWSLAASQLSCVASLVRRQRPHAARIHDSHPPLPLAAVCAQVGRSGAARQASEAGLASCSQQCAGGAAAGWRRRRQRRRRRSATPPRRRPCRHATGRRPSSWPGPRSADGGWGFEAGCCCVRHLCCGQMHVAGRQHSAAHAGRPTSPVLSLVACTGGRRSSSRRGSAQVSAA